MGSADSKPGDNPALVAAIADFARSDDDAHRAALFRELRRATYLVPILEGEVSFRTGGGAGEQVMEPGGRFQTLICADPDTGEELLPIFSDWSEVTSFTDKKVSTLLLNLDEVQGLLAGAVAYAGAVVNPGGFAIPMSRRLLATLSARAERA